MVVLPMFLSSLTRLRSLDEEIVVLAEVQPVASLDGFQAGMIQHSRVERVNGTPTVSMRQLAKQVCFYHSGPLENIGETFAEQLPESLQVVDSQYRYGVEPWLFLPSTKSRLIAYQLHAVLGYPSRPSLGVLLSGSVSVIPSCFEKRMHHLRYHPWIHSWR